MERLIQTLALLVAGGGAGWQAEAQGQIELRSSQLSTALVYAGDDLGIGGSGSFLLRANDQVAAGPTLLFSFASDNRFSSLTVVMVGVETRVRARVTENGATYATLRLGYLSMSATAPLTLRAASGQSGGFANFHSGSGPAVGIGIASATELGRALDFVLEIGTILHSIEGNGTLVLVARAGVGFRS